MTVKNNFISCFSAPPKFAPGAAAPLAPPQLRPCQQFGDMTKQVRRESEWTSMSMTTFKTICCPQSVFFPILKALPQFLTMSIFTLKPIKLRKCHKILLSLKVSKKWLNIPLFPYFIPEFLLIKNIKGKSKKNRRIFIAQFYLGREHKQY